MPTVTLTRKQLTGTLCGVALCLVVLHLIGAVVYFVADDPSEYLFIDFVDLGYEQNIPTAFSSLLFFINAAALFLLWRQQRAVHHPDQHHWMGLTFIFLFLGFDESAALHENLGNQIEPYVDATGYLYFPWFIPYLVLFIGLVALYLPFYARQTRFVQIRFFLAALVYISGAVGFDMLSANEAYEHGTRTVSYCVLYTIEEILEMAGLLIFADTLYQVVRQRKITVGFDSSC